MAIPWFDPNLYAWIPGSLLGVIGGILGAAAGVMAPLGKGRRIILPMWIGVTIFSGCLAVAGVWAFISGQPYGIWYGLGEPGFLGLVLFGGMLPLILWRYRSAGAHKTPVDL